ncbi:cysteine synthase A [Aestuariibacter sp. P117]|uniref:Cysteine synthase n=2 Tax=Glaciecola petra TaxID=3075602 RepID=A0ABU2ZRQ8_9ALTE|nr:cysteine synthase A [Aestuariibacter sp. P117]MDT0595322.1 cysteine synthase A [Aestuariibacter sp. P117]
MNMRINKHELSLKQENQVIDFKNAGIRGKVYDNILQTIGNTPLVKMKRIGEHLKLSANVLAKIEYFNPAGSIKDRPAIAMIDALMASENFSDKTEIIDATSGNNGVACAWICAYYGIRLTIVIPEHMSIERRKMIHHYGAKIVTTPKELGTKGAIDQAKLMVAQNPNALMLDQFGNQANPDQHASTTAQEIIRDTQGKIDIFVAGVGTGGTLTGVGNALKAYNPNIEVIAVEPASCPVLSQGRKGTHAIQGLSSGHVPDILDTSLIDEIITVGDGEAIEYARLLARKESLAIGISCGAAMYASAKVAYRSENTNKNIVTIFADTAERYYSTPLFEYTG